MTSGVEFWLCVWRAVLGLSSLEGSLTYHSSHSTVRVLGQITVSSSLL